MNAVVSFVKRKIFRIDRDRWNYQYTKGVWDGLRTPEELARFSIIVGYVKFFKPGQPEILEIGCGEGLLQQRLQPQNYGRYVGTDISDAAVAKAQAQADDKCRYLAADMDTYEPEGQYDLIIFNEVIYYSKHPVDTLRRLATYLKPDGLLVVTVNGQPRHAQLLTDIRAGFTLADETTVSNAKNTWFCLVGRY